MKKSELRKIIREEIIRENSTFKKKYLPKGKSSKYNDDDVVEYFHNALDDGWIEHAGNISDNDILAVAKKMGVKLSNNELSDVWERIQDYQIQKNKFGQLKYFSYLCINIIKKITDFRSQFVTLNYKPLKFKRRLNYERN